MRFIRAREIELKLPTDWEKRAKEALEKVRNLPDEERSVAINNKSSLWSELKAVLSEASDGKCWYCESSERRSDLAVDHFRPKNRVAGGRRGYWWLAFDWKNYRFSCTWCNSRRNGQVTTGGKGDQFPLLQGEDLRGSPEQGIEELDEQERPKLIDPMKWRDLELMTVDMNGRVAFSGSKDEDPEGFERVMASVALYHLDEERLVLARKDRMLDVRDLMSDLVDAHDDEPRANELFGRIANYLQEGAEYAFACREAARLSDSELAEAIFRRL